MVIELKDPFTYVFDDKTRRVIAVMWKKGKSHLAFGGSGFVDKIGESPKPHELRQLMVMWLAINYPDQLSFDAMKEEAKIKNSTK